MSALRPATGLLIALCVGAYVVTALAGGQWLAVDAGDLIRFGGSYAPAMAAGEAWRLWSAIFLHGGLLHLLVNMIALRDIGSEVESRNGAAVMATVFLIAGAAGFLASALGRPEVVSIGASGGILGLIGHWGVSLWRGGGLAPGERRGRLLALAVYLLLIFGMGVLVPGIDQWAHLGGLLGGASLALLHLRRLSGRRRQGLFWLACLVATLGLPLATRGFPPAWQARYEEHQAYVARYREFAASDRLVNAHLQALGRDSRAGRLSDAEALAVIDREILPRLAENRRRWQNVRFASPRLETERNMWARYAELRDEAVQALRHAAATGSRASLRRFEALMQQAATLVEPNAQAEQAVTSGDAETPEK